MSNDGLEHIARAIGAAISQRKFISVDGVDELRRWREPALVQPGEDQSVAEKRLDEFIDTVMRPSAAKASAPTHTPPAAMGANLITEGGSGEGAQWRAGVGAGALTKMVYDEMDNEADGFGGAAGHLIRGFLNLLARVTVPR